MSVSQVGRVLKRNYPAYYLGGAGNGQPVKNVYGQILKRNLFMATLAASAGSGSASLVVPGVSYSEDEYGRGSWTMTAGTSVSLSRTMTPSPASTDPTDTAYGPGVLVPGEFYSNAFSAVAWRDSGTAEIGEPGYDTEGGVFCQFSVTANFQVVKVFAPYYDDPATFAALDYFAGLPYKSIMDRVEGSIGRWCVLVRASATASATFRSTGYFSIEVELLDGSSVSLWNDRTGANNLLYTFSASCYAAYTAAKHRMHDGIQLAYFGQTEVSKSGYPEPYPDAAKYGSCNIASLLTPVLSGTTFSLAAS